MQGKINDVRRIQNAMWAIYKEFLSDHNPKGFAEKAGKLVHEYRGDALMRSYCENLFLAWVPVINDLAEGFRHGKGAGK